MKLGVWQRAAIVASGLWMVSGTLWQVHDSAKQADVAIQLDRELCLKVNDPNRDCFAEGVRTRDLMIESAWTRGALVSAFYLIVTWLLLGIAYGLARWILAGRKKAG